MAFIPAIVKISSTLEIVNSVYVPVIMQAASDPAVVTMINLHNLANIGLV